MLGKRKLIAGIVAMLLLTAAAGLGFLTDILVQGIVGSLLVTVAGNATEHVAQYLAGKKNAG